MWQKFDTEGIVHKKFVPPGHTVNGKCYCNVLRWVRENIWHKCPDKWHNSSWGPHHDNGPAQHAARAAVFGIYEDNCHPPPSLPTRPHHPWFFPIPKDHIEAQGVKFWQQWRISDQIVGRSDDADAKGLPIVLPIMKILPGSMYQCRRGLLWRGWGQIEIPVSG